MSQPSRLRGNVLANDGKSFHYFYPSPLRTNADLLLIATEPWISHLESGYWLGPQKACDSKVRRPVGRLLAIKLSAAMHVNGGSLRDVRHKLS